MVARLEGRSLNPGFGDSIDTNVRSIKKFSKGKVAVTVDARTKDVTRVNVHGEILSFCYRDSTGKILMHQETRSDTIQVDIIEDGLVLQVNDHMFNTIYVRHGGNPKTEIKKRSPR